MCCWNICYLWWDFTPRIAAFHPEVYVNSVKIHSILKSHLQVQAHSLHSKIGSHSSAILSCQVWLKLPQMASWHEVCFFFKLFLWNKQKKKILFLFLKRAGVHVQEPEGQIWCWQRLGHLRWYRVQIRVGWCDPVHPWFVFTSVLEWQVEKGKILFMLSVADSGFSCAAKVAGSCAQSCEHLHQSCYLFIKVNFHTKARSSIPEDSKLSLSRNGSKPVLII